MMYFLLFLVLLFLVLNLRGRIIQLENIVDQHMKPSSVSQKKVQPNVETVEHHEERYEDVQQSPNAFVEWVKEDWLMKLGALLLLIGFGWLTTYAFLNNWIGPMGRISLGIIAGVILLVVGWWRIQKYFHQGGIFLVTGSTTILLTVFAARSFYQFFTPFTALALMFLSAAFVAFVSVRHKSKSLALSSLILAGVAPLLVHSPSPDYVALFLYLLVVVVGTLWIVAITEMRELTVAALILIFLYSVPHLSGAVTAETTSLLYCAYAFSAVFFFSNTAGILHSRDKDISADLISAGGNGLFLLAWVLRFAPVEWKSLIIAAWLIVFVSGGFAIFRSSKKREPFYVYAGVGIAMLAAATAVELNGYALSIAYTVESAVVSLLAFFVLKDARIALRLSLLLIVSMVYSVESLHTRFWSLAIPMNHFAVLFVLMIALLGLAVFFIDHTSKLPGSEQSQINTFLFVAGSFYAFALVWLSLKALLTNDDTAVMLSLLIYTIVGLAVYFEGRKNEIRSFLIYGGTLLGFVVLRLLLVEVWRMAMVGRITTFFVVGALLMSTAFLGRKK